MSLELSALRLELAHQHYVAFLAAHGVKRSRLPSPLRVPRPGDPKPKPKPRRAASVAEVMAVLSAGHAPKARRR